jgi:hypothetical protein
MTSQPEESGCAECSAFDAETKRLMAELFSSDERVMLMLLTAASIKISSMQLQKAGRNDIKTALRCRRDMDFASVMIGKFIVSFEPEQRDALLAQVRKDHGLAFNVKDESCPHKPKPTGPACRAV